MGSVPDGREPVELKSGKVFRVEVDGVLRVTRMRHTPRRGYYAADGYELRDGMRAATGASE